METPYEVVDSVLITLDKATLSTPAHLHTWVTSARQRYGEVPLVVCGTKIDLLPQYGNAISRSLAPHVHALGVTYYDLSSKTNYNLEKPWVYLARQLTGNPNLRLP